MWEPNYKPTSGSHLIEKRFKCIDIHIDVYFFGEPDRFSHSTQIRFLEFSISFIGSSCASSHLGLLLFSHYCSSLLIAITPLFTFFSHTAITPLPLLFLSLYYYYSSFCCYYCYFSRMVLLLPCDEVIKLLILIIETDFN
jgi:hypothetical protein